jgi:hypothetical protein
MAGIRYFCSRTLSAIMIRYLQPILVFGFLFLCFSSCKERNEIYPPVPWVTYFYEKENIAPRPVSAILLNEKEHFEWYGSLNDKGLVNYNGYDWKEFFDAENSSVPFDSVTSIVQDKNGLVWVSWKSGLANFDGSSWKLATEFTGKRVTSLAIQGIGIVWAGLDGDQQTGGLARYSNGNWEFFNPLETGIPSYHVTALAVDHDQRLWIGTSDKGIIHYDNHVWTGIRLDSAEVVPSRINSIAIDPGGIVWAGTASSQLVKFTDAGPVLLYTGTGKPITSLQFQADGKMWIGTAGAGVLTYLNGEWTSYTSANMHLPGDSILTLAIHPEGNILASYPDGHVIYFK